MGLEKPAEPEDPVAVCSTSTRCVVCWLLLTGLIYEDVRRIAGVVRLGRTLAEWVISHAESSLRHVVRVVGVVGLQQRGGADSGSSGADDHVARAQPDPEQHDQG